MIQDQAKPRLITWLEEAAADVDADWAADNQPISQGGPRADGDPLSPKPWNAMGDAAGLLVEADEIITDCGRYLSEFGSIDPENLAWRIRSWRTRLAVARGPGQ